MNDLGTIVDFNLLRIIFATSMLFIATILDSKKREVHDLLWVIYGIIAIVLVFPELQNFEMLMQIGMKSKYARTTLFIILGYLLDFGTYNI